MYIVYIEIWPIDIAGGGALSWYIFHNPWEHFNVQFGYWSLVDNVHVGHSWRPSLGYIFLNVVNVIECNGFIYHSVCTCFYTIMVK